MAIEIIVSIGAAGLRILSGPPPRGGIITFHRWHDLDLARNHGERRFAAFP